MAIDGPSYANESRIRFRVELAGPNKTAAYSLCAWPFYEPTSGDYPDICILGPGWFITPRTIGLLKRHNSQFVTGSKKELTQAFSPDGVHEVVCEKRGAKVTIWCNDIRMLEAVLSEEHLSVVKEAPVRIGIGTYSYASAPDAALKVTLLELSVGKDLPPYQPAATQPAGQPAGK